MILTPELVGDQIEMMPRNGRNTSIHPSIPYHFVRGWIYYLADTCEIAVMHNTISCFMLDVLFSRPGRSQGLLYKQPRD